jgi:hypothetical protein
MERDRMRAPARAVDWKRGKKEEWEEDWINRNEDQRLTSRLCARRLPSMLYNEDIPRSTRPLIDYFSNQNPSRFRPKISSSPFRVSSRSPWG